MTIAELSRIDPDQLATLVGVRDTGRGSPAIQVRIGPSGGPLYQGHIDELQELAGNLMLTGHGDPEGRHGIYIDPKCTAGIAGTGAEFIALGKTLGGIAGAAETNLRPVKGFSLDL